MVFDFAVFVFHVGVVEPEVFHEKGILFGEREFQDPSLLVLVDIVDFVFGNGVVDEVVGFDDVFGDFLRRLLRH